MRKLLSILLCLSLYSISYGAYLKDVPYELIQPNGEVLNVYITGDEFFRRVHDINGYSIVQREDGWFCYAVYDAENDELIASNYIVSSNQQVQLPMEKGLGISYEKYMEIRRAYFEPTGCDPSGAANKSVLEDLANTKTVQQMNNIIICIGFSDTPGMTNNFNYVNGMYNYNTNNNMRDYYQEMSYGKLDLISHFYPPADENVLRFYQDENPRNYYRPYNASTNTIGYTSTNRTTREHTLLRNAVNWVNENWPIPEDINLDINNDGECDFITFIIYGGVGGWNDLLWPHKWSLFTGPANINGKQVNTYNFELDGTSTYFNVGVFCHEGFHVLGAPDLYHYNEPYNAVQAVGVWDVMESTNNSKPQSMCAYLKLRYGRWIHSDYTHLTFPAATINQTYEIFPFYFNDGSDVEKPILHRIPMTDITSQYTTVEYRKKADTNYDSSLPNEGLLIYRINTGMSGNAQFNGTSNVDEIYLYRPGSYQTSGVYTQGDLPNAPYNSTNGKKEFNSTTDPKPCRSNGTAETEQNINNILYDSVTDSYTFFYGDPETRNMSISADLLTIASPSGSGGTISVTSNVLWRVSVPNSADWLSASITKGLNNNTVTFTASSANTGIDRAANILFTGNNQTFTVTVIQSGESNNTPYPVNLVSASIADNKAVIEWMKPGILTSTTYILDDGTPEAGYRLSPNFAASLGNQFNVDENGFITSIDVYARNRYDNTDREVTVDIYNADKELITSSEPIALKGDAWTNVPINNIPYSNTFYAMLSWQATAGQTHELGYDKNGDNVNSELNWRIANGSWTIFHKSVSGAGPGVWMIRANTNTLLNNDKVNNIENYKIYRLLQGQSEENWTLLSDSETENKYLDIEWNSLPIGLYQYAVKAEYADNVISEAVLSNVLDKITSNINESEIVQFALYPNPANNVLNINRSVTGKAKIEIFTCTGSLILDQAFENEFHSTKVDISILATGIYLIKLTDKNGSSIQRFVKR